ncbi:Hsp20/alpha crystallin family protein [Pseudomonas sp. H11T01]|uniref:Hsp20/alpha crystallin family protein n=1 Tax=Pseudomonas sp. H11T01 TaxID=3402749 RepID=UPI003AC0F72A
MSSSVKKMPVSTEQKPRQTPVSKDLWRPFESLRQQIDHLFEDFGRGSPLSPFSRSLFDVEPFSGSLLDVEPIWRRELSGRGMPAVDICEQDKSYEITAELPGMDEKDIEIKLSNGSLIIKGEKKSDREEQRKGYHLTERSYGSFERVFNLPKGVDVDKIDAHFSKGVLTVSLPKIAEAIKPEKVVKIKAD